MMKVQAKDLQINIILLFSEDFKSIYCQFDDNDQLKLYSLSQQANGLKQCLKLAHFIQKAYHMSDLQSYFQLFQISGDRQSDRCQQTNFIKCIFFFIFNLADPYTFHPIRKLSQTNPFQQFFNQNYQMNSIIFFVSPLFFYLSKFQQQIAIFTKQLCIQILFLLLMSVRQLTSRDRTLSQATLRKRLLRSGSSDRQDITRNTTSASFRPKLERLIKQGKLDQILNSDPHSKANLYYTTHINQMQKQLAATKKSLSTMVLKSKSKEYSINKLKNDLRKVEHQSGILKKQARFATQNLNEKKQQLEIIKETVEEKTWREKSYAHVKVRLINDELYLKALHQNKDIQYKRALKEYADMETKYYQLSQANTELIKMNQQAQKISGFQANEKNQFIELINQDMMEKDMLDNLKAEKARKDAQINFISGSLIEKEELAKYMKILFAHRILKQIIKTKSNQLFQKYNDQTKAYMEIKSNTNIAQFDKILHRMESQDSAYEATLKRVDDLQKQLSKIENEVQQSIQNRNALYSNEKQIPKQSYYHGVYQDQHELLVSEKSQLFEKKKSNQILRKRIILWAEDYYPQYHIQSQNKSFFDSLNDLVRMIKTGKQ